jgi:hypothetical protein
MPDQTVKHDNSLPGFLLILLPAAFGAVFLSVAWPFILGAVVLLTGNNVWQSYQWAKLSQQVNPYFMQMVLEQQGEIAPLALSARAKISAPVADRYLQGKAAEIGGVSYRSTAGDTVYSFLTVNSLEKTFAGLDPTVSVSQKLSDMEYVLADAEVSTVQVTPATTAEFTSIPVEVATASDTPAIVPPSTLEIEQPIASSPVPEAIEPVASVASVETKIVETAPVKPVVSAVPEVAVEPVVAKSTDAAASGSTFAQALRTIFNAEHTEPVAEDAIALEPITASVETISQTDLAKRLDVHPSTLYKRRSDVSFGEWTRNRDPEGVAWGYQKDTKEFYRLT